MGERHLEKIGSDSVIAIVFYFPWDGVSEMLLRGVSTAYHRLQPQSLTVVRMDCFDWPQECNQFNIEEQPKLTVFYRNNSVSYRGVYTEDALLRIFCLNQLPYALRTLKEVELFLSGEFLNNADIEASSVVVLHPSRIEAHRIHNQLETLRGKIPYTTVEATVLQETHGKYYEGLISLLVQKQGETFTAHQYGPVQLEELSETIASVARPMLPHLDEGMFSEVLQSRTFGIFFMSDTKQLQRTAHALSGREHHIRFAWVKRNENVAKSLSTSYTDQLAFCLLHDKKACCYSQEEFQVTNMPKEIERMINSSQWVPLRTAQW